MIINEDAIKIKYKYLDAIKENYCLLYKVLNKNLDDKYQIENINRIWDGGGSTLYKIETEKKSYILKVKSSEMMVESKLEEEIGCIDESCLKHERNMLIKARDIGVFTPNILFFEQCDGFDFLALEYIEDSLITALDNATIDELIVMWDSLVENVKILYENGIVHSDLHENNIRYEKGKIYIIDFEEARFLRQEVPFKQSLDYIGYNSVSTLGKFPYFMQQEYTNPYNCLARMKEVFNSYLSKKVFEYVRFCNYDSQNGICTSLDHGISNKTYQAIHNKYFAVEGQRWQDDRIKVIEAACSLILKKQFTFIDVGSNNGLFCRDMCLNVDKAIRCIGLEGFHHFNILAKGLAFLEDIERTEYIDFVCGEDSLRSLNISGDIVFSICSVWHHIENRDAFLNEIKELDVQMIIFEFAVQDDLYDGLGWENETERIKQRLEFEGKYLLAKSLDYDRPLILLTKNKIDKSIINQIHKRVLTRGINDSFTLVSRREERLKNYIDRSKEKNKYIVCFGTGQYGEKAASFFGENIAFYIDNDKSKREFLDYMVLSPNEAVKLIGQDTKVVISTSKKYQDEIRKQLEDLNIQNIISLDELLEKGWWYGKYSNGINNYGIGEM